MYFNRVIPNKIKPTVPTMKASTFRIFPRAVYITWKNTRVKKKYETEFALMETLIEEKGNTCKYSVQTPIIVLATRHHNLRAP